MSIEIAFLPSSFRVSTVKRVFDILEFGTSKVSITGYSLSDSTILGFGMSSPPIGLRFLHSRAPPGFCPSQDGRF